MERIVGRCRETMVNDAIVGQVQICRTPDVEDQRRILLMSRQARSYWPNRRPTTQIPRCSVKCECVTDDFDILVQALEADDEEQVVRTAHTLGDSGDPRAVPLLIRLLETTDEPNVRDAAEVGLRELRDSRAVGPLLRQIADPRNAGHQGTLVYALECLDAGPAVRDLGALMGEDGTYEVMAMVLRVLEGIRRPLPQDVVSDSLPVRRDELRRGHCEDWQRSMLSRAAEILNQHSAV